VGSSIIAVRTAGAIGSSRFAPFFSLQKGLAFNMMSKYVEYENDELFYEEPEKAFSFVKKNITPYVNLIHDYQVKDDCIPL